MVWLEDAVNEDELVLCCAFCCANCGLYPACDSIGCSGKVRTILLVSSEGVAMDVHQKLKSFLFIVGWSMLLEHGVLLQTWSSIALPMRLRGHSL